MKCPTDDTVLQMTERQGIEIDYCPQCRGVWLDRGELDKIIDRAVADQPAAPAPPQQSGQFSDLPRNTPSYPAADRDDRRRDRSYDDHRRDSGYYKKRKKESFLGELFDF